MITRFDLYDKRALSRLSFKVADDLMTYILVVSNLIERVVLMPGI